MIIQDKAGDQWVPYEDEWVFVGLKSSYDDLEEKYGPLTIDKGSKISVPPVPEGITEVWDYEGGKWVEKNGSWVSDDCLETWESLVAVYGPLSLEPPIENNEGDNVLTELAKDIHERNRDKGFWDDYRPLTETTMLIVTELSEAVEEDRAGNPGHYVVNGKPEGTDVELVDALIRLLDLLGSRGTAIDRILEEKLAYNETRPAKHGKRY